MVENIDGKGENASTKTFSFSHNSFNSLSAHDHLTSPNGKILDVTKLKAFADDKLNVAQMTMSLSDRVENTVGKGENAGSQHFFLFPQCFPKLSSLGSLKVGRVW